MNILKIYKIIMINEINYWDFISNWCEYIKNNSNLKKYILYRDTWRRNRLKLYKKLPKNIKFSDIDE